MKRKPPALLNIGIELDARAIADFSCDYPVQLSRLLSCIFEGVSV